MIDYEVTVDDPVTYVRPFTMRMTITTQPTTALRCACHGERRGEMRAQRRAPAKSRPRPSRRGRRSRRATRESHGRRWPAWNPPESSTSGNRRRSRGPPGDRTAQAGPGPLLPSVGGRPPKSRAPSIPTGHRLALTARGGRCKRYSGSGAHRCKFSSGVVIARFSRCRVGNARRALAFQTHQNTKAQESAPQTGELVSLWFAKIVLPASG